MHVTFYVVSPVGTLVAVAVVKTNRHQIRIVATKCYELDTVEHLLRLVIRSGINRSFDPV